MLRVPHRLIEGCLITAHAIQSQARLHLHPRRVPRRVRGAARGARRGARRRAARRRRRSSSTAAPARTSAARRPALLESLEGKRGQPRSKPPFPAIQGLYASPTLINNVETIATVPKIVELGGGGVREARRRRTRPARASSRCPATSCSGGNYELEHGMTLRELIYDVGGGMPDGRELKAVIPGGSSMPVILTRRRGRHAARLRLARAGRARSSARAASSCIDDRCCMVQLGAARRGVLHARVVRQVHAVP